MSRFRGQILVVSVFVFPVALMAEDAIVERVSSAKRSFTGLREFNQVAAPSEIETTAISNITVINGLGGTPIQNGVVVVKGDKIVAVGRANEITIPTDAKIVDGAGHSVLPGLLDAHFHTGKGAQVVDLPKLFLSHGVTTARDPGRHIEAYLPLKGASDPVPRMFVTGPHFDQSPPAYPENSVIIKSPADARRAVKQYVDQGGSGIKVYFRLPHESIVATCEAAHLLGIPVTAHLELIDADDGIVAGLDGIEHVTSFGTSLADPEDAEEFRHAVADENEARRNGRYRLWAKIDLDDNPRLKPLLKTIVDHGVFVSPTFATFERRVGDKDISEYHVQGFQQMLRFVGICNDAGATVVTGSHTWAKHQKMGWAYQREMELLVEAGLTPLEAVTASTISNARFFGCADRLGSLEAGKLADLVIVKGRPDQDIRSMYDISRVMLGGVWVAGESSP